MYQIKNHNLLICWGSFMDNFPQKKKSVASSLKHVANPTLERK